MKGPPTKFRDFVIHPEYCGLEIEELELLSADGKYHIAALPWIDNRNMLTAFHDGKLIYQRAKSRLFPGEYCKRPGEVAPETVKLGSLSVLLLNCYEIMFPGDYLIQNSGKPNLVIHLVGTPMFDENQREGWTALQQVLSLYYRCPVVCCCGGRKGRMNISGVTGNLT